GRTPPRCRHLQLTAGARHEATSPAPRPARAARQRVRVRRCPWQARDPSLLAAGWAGLDAADRAHLPRTAAAEDDLDAARRREPLPHLGARLEGAPERPRQ